MSPITATSNGSTFAGCPACGYPTLDMRVCAVCASQLAAILPVSEATTVGRITTAPKSNAVITALGAAMNDIRAGKAGLVPAHLHDGHYPAAAKLGNAVDYR